MHHSGGGFSFTDQQILHAHAPISSIVRTWAASNLVMLSLLPFPSLPLRFLHLQDGLEYVGQGPLTYLKSKVAKLFLCLAAQDNKSPRLRVPMGRGPIGII
jgi:hypothetical protein